MLSHMRKLTLDIVFCVNIAPIFKVVIFLLVVQAYVFRIGVSGRTVQKS